MVRYSGYFDLVLKSQIIINVNKIACLDIQSRYFQSVDVNSRSQYHFSHVKIDTWLEVNFATLLSQRCDKQRVSFNNKRSIKACVKCAQLLTANYRLSSNCCNWLVSEYKHDMVSGNYSLSVPNHGYKRISNAIFCRAI